MSTRQPLAARAGHARIRSLRAVVVATTAAGLLLAPLLVDCARRSPDRGAGGSTTELPAQPPSRDDVSDDALPTPPLRLAAPPAPDVPYDLHARSRSARALFVDARAAAARGDLEAAIRLGERAVSRGGRGHGLLARAYARRADVTSSFYWLQRAALEEGVDPATAADDDDLAPLRADPRWAEVATFLGRASAHWASSGRHALVVITPDGLPTARAVPVLVGLHDDGDEPDDFLDHDAYQRRALRLGVVFVGVSGTVPLGPKTYRWSFEPAENAKRIEEALAEARARVPLAADKVILFGFSEGAQAALEIAAREPARYRGAIAMSPGGLPWRISELAANPLIARQRYVIAVASFESLDAVGTSYVDADLLRGLGATVRVHTAWLYAVHALPPDFEVRLPQWIDFMLDARGR